jgi:hypothetical protein
VPDVGVAVATPTSATGALGRGGLDDRGSEEVLQFVLGERPVVGAGQAGQQPGRDQLAAHVHAMQQRASSKLGRAGRGGQRACVPTLVMRIRSTGAATISAGITTEMVSLRTSSRGGSGHDARHWTRFAPSVCGSVPAIVDDPRLVTYGTEPAAPC